jgi:hypothetical protein
MLATDETKVFHSKVYLKSEECLIIELYDWIFFLPANQNFLCKFDVMQNTANNLMMD